MTIHSTNNLQGENLKHAENFIKVCQAYDKTYRTPYFSNVLNFDHDMPAFFMAYDNDRLIGLLTVYADTPDVEVTINVHPDYRKQGFARALYQAFLDKTKTYGLKSHTFMTEKVFLEKNPDLIDHWGLVIDEDTEIWLGRDRQAVTVTLTENSTIRQAKLEDVDAIASLKSEAFENDIEVSKHYAKEAILDDKSLLYILETQGQIVGSCTVDLSTDLNYLYGLAILKDYRGKSLGSSLVKQIINDLLAANNYHFQIAVDHDNTGARRLYEKLGFTYQTEVIYLNKK